MKMKDIITERERVMIIEVKEIMEQRIKLLRGRGYIYRMNGSFLRGASTF